MEFRKHVLANGLEIVAECNAQAYSTALAFFVKTGARDETADVSGVSHFLEHMVFKGTATRSAADVNRELDEIGSHSNAYTSEEETVYYATVLPEYQTHALELLADILRPALRGSDFDMEKQVILEEIFKYEDQPPFGAHEKCMAAYFGSHSLGNSILGTVESVTALTPDAMLKYFQRRYSAANIVLVAAGNVDFDDLIRTADRLCGHWPKQDAHRTPGRATPQSRFQVITKEAATQQYAVQISSGPAADHPDRYAHRLLATIVGDDTGSRLFWALVDPGLAEFAAMSSYEFDGCGIMMTYLCCAPDMIAENLQCVRDLQREAERQGLRDEELELAKSKVCAHVVLRSERPSNRLFAVGNNWIHRQTYQTVKETVDAYQAVTMDDVRRTLEQYPLTAGTTVSIGPLREVACPV